MIHSCAAMRLAWLAAAMLATIAIGDDANASVPTAAPAQLVSQPHACRNGDGTRDGNCCTFRGNAFCAEGHDLVWEGSTCCAVSVPHCSYERYMCYGVVGLPTSMPTPGPDNGAPTMYPTFNEMGTEFPTPAVMPTEFPTHTGVANPDACVDAEGEKVENCCTTRGNAFCAAGHDLVEGGGTCCSLPMYSCPYVRFTCYTNGEEVPTSEPTQVHDGDKCFEGGAENADCCAVWANASCTDGYVKHWTGNTCCHESVNDGDCWQYHFQCQPVDNSMGFLGRVAGDTRLIVSDPTAFCSNSSFVTAVKMSVSKLLGSAIAPDFVDVTRCEPSSAHLRRRLQGNNGSSEVVVTFTASIFHSDRDIAEQMTLDAARLVAVATAADMEAVMNSALAHELGSSEATSAAGLSVNSLELGAVTAPGEGQAEGPAKLEDDDGFEEPAVRAGLTFFLVIFAFFSGVFFYCAVRRLGRRGNEGKALVGNKANTDDLAISTSHGFASAEAAGGVEKTASVVDSNVPACVLGFPTSYPPGLKDGMPSSTE